MTALVLPITAKVHLKIRKYLAVVPEKYLEGVHGFIDAMAHGLRFVTSFLQEVLTIPMASESLE
jgi:hypothetical protein